MSQTIDERVVSMKFDNADFERKSKQSLSTLEKLKNALNFTGASKGLEEIERASNNMSFDNVANSLDFVSSRFSNLGIVGMSIIQNLTDRFVNMGISIVKSMTPLEQAGVGWSKYAEKTQAVQTIMSATNETWNKTADVMAKVNALQDMQIKGDLFEFTPQEMNALTNAYKDYASGAVSYDEALQNLQKTFNTFDNSNPIWTNNTLPRIFKEIDESIKDVVYDGSQMEYVTEQIEKLNTFTDETSYSFLDMVNNIGKFTNNNIPLDKAVIAMEGISNWAALSGANVQEAGRAMYNLSQAMAVGRVQLMDWKSIENANMATAEFKQTVIDTAVAQGTLTKTGEGLYKTLKGNEVSISKFNSSLQDGWFTSNVLMESLDKFGGFSDKLIENMAELNDEFTASQMLEFIDQYKEGTLEIDELANEAGVTSQRFRDIISNLASDEYELGRTAFKAAQEAKTFEEAINSVKDAVSTGWMTTFELIFGNYQEAKVLWTKLAEELYDVFAEGGNQRNAMLEIWNETGGRDAFIESIWNIWDTIKNVSTAIQEEIEKWFPAKSIKEKAEKLLEITKSFRDFTKQLKDLTTPMNTSLETFDEMGNMIGYFPETKFDRIQDLFSGFIATFRFLKDVAAEVIDAFSPIVGYLKDAGEVIFNTLADLSRGIADFFEGFKRNDNSLETFDEMGNMIDTFPISKFYKISDFIHNVADKIFKSLDSIIDGFKNFGEEIKGSDLFGALENVLASGWNKVKEFFNGEGSFDITEGSFLDNLKKFGQLLWDAITGKFGEAFSYLQEHLPTISSIVGIIQTVLTELFNALNEATKGNGASVLHEIAASILMIVIALELYYSSSPFEVFDSMTGFFDMFYYQGLAALIKSVAIAIGVLAGSLVAVSLVDTSQLVGATIAIGLLLKMLENFAVRIVAMSSILVSSKGIVTISSMFVALSAAIFIISSAMKKIASLDPGKMILSLGAISILIWELAGIAKLLTSDNSIISSKKIPSLKPLIAFAISILLLVQAIKSLGQLSGEQLGIGLTGVVSLVLMLGLLAERLGQIKRFPKMGGFIAFASSIMILVMAMKVLGTMGGEELGTSLFAISVLILELGALMVVVGNMQKTPKMTPLIAFSISLLLVVAAVKTLSNIPGEKLGQGLLGISLLIFELGLLMEILGKSGANMGAVANIVAVSFALIVLTAAINILGNMKVENVAQGLLALAGGLIIIGVAASALGPGIVALSGLGMTIAAVIGAIALAAIAFTLLGASLATFGVSVDIVVRTIIDIFKGLLTGFIELFPLLVEAVATLVLGIITGLANAVTPAAVAIINLLVSLANVIGANAGVLIDAAINLMTDFMFGLSRGIVDNTDVVIGALENLLLSILYFVVTGLQEMISSIPVFGEQLSGALDGIKGKIEADMAANEELKNSGKQTIEAVGSGMTEAANNSGDIASAATSGIFSHISGAFQGLLPEFEGLGSEGYQSMLSGFGSAEIDPSQILLPNGLFDGLAGFNEQFFNQGSESADQYNLGIGAKEPQANSAGSSLALEGYEGANLQQSQYKNAGANAGQGFIDGLDSKVESARGAGRRIAEAALNAAMQKLQEASPSKAMIKVGSFAGEGFVIGLVNWVGKAANAASELADSSISGMQDSIASISSIVSDNMDLNPTITPNLDLSNVMNGAKQINRLLESNALNANGSISGENQNGTVLGNGMTFVQNNYSPKALSRIEIYRQTRNQFAMAKGLVDA